jgi:hypothetical protein
MSRHTSSTFTNMVKEGTRKKAANKNDQTSAWRPRRAQFSSSKEASGYRKVPPQSANLLRKIKKNSTQQASILSVIQ